MRKNIGLFLSILFLLVGGGKVTANIDSLKEHLSLSLNDSIKTDVYIALCNELYFNKPNELENYATKFIEHSMRTNDTIGLVNALNYRALYHSYKSDLKNANLDYIQCLALCRAIENTRGIAATLNNLAINYIDLREYDKAMTYLEQMVPEFDRLPKDSELKSAYYVNLGNIYFEQKQFKQALENFLLAKKVSVTAASIQNYSNALVNISACYWEMKEFNWAKKHGLFALNFAKKNSIEHSQVFANYYLSKIYKDLNRLDSAIYYANESFYKAKYLEWPDQIANAYELKEELALASNNYKDAYYFSKLRDDITDSLYSVEKSKEIAIVQSQFEDEERQMENQILKQKNALNAKVIERQEAVNLFSALSMVLMIGIVVLLYRNNQNKKKANAQLNQNKEELKQLNATLEASNELKNRMLSIISHDLRAPMQNLQAVVDLLSTGTLDVTESEFLMRDLKAQINNTNSMLDNLLYWAKSQMKGISLNQEIIDIQQLTTEIIELYKPLADKKSLRISNEIDLHQLVYADKNMIELVLRNLLNNSIKFSAHHKAIKFYSKPKGDFIEIFVEDEAGGVPIHIENTLFKTEVTASTKGTSNEHGAGLGITMSNDFVKRNGGRLRLQNKAGIGAIFHFTVPKAS